MDFYNPRTKYESVADAIRRFVRDKELRPGDRLPTEHDLAKQMGVSYLTVRRANEQLESEGLIFRQRGRGTFIAEPESQLHRATVGFLGVSRELEGYLLQQYMHLRARLSELPFPCRLVFDHVIPYGGEPLLTPQFQDGIDALVVYGSFDDHIAARLSEIPVPLVVLGNCPRARGVPGINYDFNQLTRQLVRVLVETLGYDDVWMTIEPFRLTSTHEFVASYRQAVEEGLIPCELLVPMEQNAFDPFVRMFNRLHPKLGKRHAVFWGHSTPFVQIDRLHPPVTPDRFGVVSYGGRKDGWNLPGAFDLGEITHAWDVMSNAMLHAVRELLTTRHATDQIIRPTVTVEQHDDGVSRPKVDWSLERINDRAEPGHDDPS